MEDKNTEYTKEYIEFCKDFWFCVQLSYIAFCRMEEEMLESAATANDPKVLVFWKRFFDLARSYRQRYKPLPLPPTGKGGSCE
ncbi:MAG: hypothetical protein IJI62_12050 [Lachnospiraceae bacterium]|nr:hypothetical protein [Lachnospiraceae bacterium]